MRKMAITETIGRVFRSDVTGPPGRRRVDGLEAIHRPELVA